MARIIAVANQKGGVGKSSVATNLPVFLAALGKRTLLVDMDPQANSTLSLRNLNLASFIVQVPMSKAAENFSLGPNNGAIRMRFFKLLSRIQSRDLKTVTG